MSPKTYKVFDAIGATSANLVRTISIIYTNAGPNSVRKDTLPTAYVTYFKSGPLHNILDASWHRSYTHIVVNHRSSKEDTDCHLA